MVGEILVTIPWGRPVRAHATHVLPECLARFEAGGRTALPVSTRVVRAFRRFYRCSIPRKEGANGVAIHEGTIP